MMSLLLATIRNNLPVAALAVLFMLAGGYGYWLRCELATREAQLEEARVRAASLERSNVSLLVALKQQNAAVTELTKRSEAKMQQAAALRSSAQHKSLAVQKAAERLLRFEPAGATQCEQIKALVGFSRELYHRDR